jgi:L-asparaginase
MTKHIGLIYAGGTIGMQKTGQGYAPMPAFGGVLAASLHAGTEAVPRYTLHEYATPIDSTNATPADWQRLGRDIAGRYREYDGFVVLHGTDTMAYTAAALSFMLQGLRKPVILTGSQVPLSEVRSDALQNIVTSLQLAACGALGEVALYFNQRLLRGNRSTKISAERFHAFDSPNYPWLAEAGIGLRINRAALLPAAQQENFELPEYASGHILSLRATPGMPLQAVRALLDLQPQALILECYGAGNLPDNDPALLDLLVRADDAGIVLLACSQALHGEVALDAYATGSGLARAGVVGCGDMTFEAIYTKLHHLFALGLAPDAVKLAMQRDIAGELSRKAEW